MHGGRGCGALHLWSTGAVEICMCRRRPRWPVGISPAYLVRSILGLSRHHQKRPRAQLGIVWEHDAPDEAFMVKEIREGALAQIRGVVKYRPEFASV